MITLQDLVSHVMDSTDLSENPVDFRRAVRSSIWGFEQATTRHQWTTYETEFTAYFNAKYEEGTISIDAAGVVTLTDGTFPAWAALGSIYIGEEKAYRVLTRDSDTQVTLENWSTETLTDSDYALRQDRVLIPDDVREVYDVWNETEDWSMRVVGYSDFRDYDQPRIYSGSDPTLVTFRSVLLSGVHRTEMRVAPAVSTPVELNVGYVRRPKRPSILVQKLASCASTVLTLDSALPYGASVVGAVLRHGGQMPPTADQVYGIQRPMEATFEGLITAQASTTVMTVPGLGDFSDQGVVISDVLDIPPFVFNAAKLYSESNMARLGRGDFRLFREMSSAADEELRYAMEQDGPYRRRESMPLLRVDRLQSTPYIVEV